MLLWSGLRPYDHVTWLEEVLPAVLGWVILAATYRRFRLTNLTYALIWCFSLILIVGGHYTYARVPLGYWAQDLFHLSRNHFDRLGHFVQGFTPAIVAREVLLRTSPLRRGKWLAFIVLCICLAISACYELIEWFAAVVSDATDFVGSQGDPWDAQWDMFLCLVGAATAIMLLGRLHDRVLRRRGLVTYGPAVRPLHETASGEVWL